MDSESVELSRLATEALPRLVGRVSHASATLIKAAESLLLAAVEERRGDRMTCRRHIESSAANVRRLAECQARDATEGRGQKPPKRAMEGGR